MVGEFLGLGYAWVIGQALISGVYLAAGEKAKMQRLALG